MRTSPPCVAVALEPAILCDALVAVLRDIGADHVVDLRSQEARQHAAPFDAAVVTVDLRDDVRADVVIELPHEGGTATVVVGDRRRVVTVGGVDAILALLDDHCPAGRRRAGYDPGRPA